MAASREAPPDYMRAALDKVAAKADRLAELAGREKSRVAYFEASKAAREAYDAYNVPGSTDTKLKALAQKYKRLDESMLQGAKKATEKLSDELIDDTAAYKKAAAAKKNEPAIKKWAKSGQ